MTQYRVTLGAAARRHVTTIGEWWAANRDIPDLFARELREAISVLADAPYAQRRYQGQ